MSHHLSRRLYQREPLADIGPVNIVSTASSRGEANDEPVDGMLSGDRERAVAKLL